VASVGLGTGVSRQQDIEQIAAMLPDALQMDRPIGWKVAVETDYDHELAARSWRRAATALYDAGLRPSVALATEAPEPAP
jgi:hypothetical protein